MPPKKCCASSALKSPKPLKVPQAQESYSQSFQATQYTHNSLSAVATQQAVVLIKDIDEVQPSSQIEDIKDESRAIFKACGETAEDKADKVNKTELLELSAEEVIKIGIPAVPSLQEPMVAVPELDLEVINLLDKLIFAAQYASEPISRGNADVKFNNFPNQDKDNKHSTYCILVDQISMVFSGCRSKQDLPI